MRAGDRVIDDFVVGQLGRLQELSVWLPFGESA
jgi:hypothetical protein